MCAGRLAKCGIWQIPTSHRRDQQLSDGKECFGMCSLTGARGVDRHSRLLPNLPAQVVSNSKVARRPRRRDLLITIECAQLG